MKAPGCNFHLISRNKITDYLLCVSHPIGRGKALFFRKCGFCPDKWTLFRDALAQHVAMNEVSCVEESPFGIRYVIEAELLTPTAGWKMVRSVWFIEKGSTDLRFVTAYPTTQGKDL